MVFLMVLLFGGASYGQTTATLKFTKACGGNGKDDKGGAWVIKSDASEVTANFDVTKGVHYGSSSKAVSYLKASSTSYSNKVISKIVVNASGASQTTAIVSCKVGEKDFGTSRSITNTNAAYTFDGEASGDIEVSLTQSSNKKALYLLSVEVTYKDVADTRTATTLSFGSDKDNNTFNLNIGDSFNAPTATLSPSIDGATITYSSDNEDVAKVDVKTGVVTLGEVTGAAKITATFAGNDDYAPSSSCYTINLSKVIKLEDGVFDFTNDGSVDYGSGLKPKFSSSYGSKYDASIVWTAGNVTLNTVKGTRWITGSPNTLRVFSSQKAEFSVSVPNGYLITLINFVGLNGGLSSDCGAFSSKTWRGAAQKVVFKATDKKDIQSISVKYIKQESVTTASNNGFATYAADYAVNYGTIDGLKAYTIKLDEANSKVTYNEFSGVVPAGQAVLVKGEAGKTYSLEPATEDADASFSTDLKASDGTVEAADSRFYAFGYSSKNEISGFMVIKNGVKIPAKKGYLELTSTTNAKDFFAFDGSTTGIDDTTVDIPVDDDDVPLFNLAGQRVGANYKGIVIKNGKKFVNK